jgi:phage/plasmid-associated DNA primase
MLGDLAIKISTSLLTGKKSNLGSASPELCRASIGVRWAAMDEPNSDEIINAGILKNYTGNDSFFARDLFQKGKETREITPFFKLHLLCNQLPTIKNGDSASFKRIRIIPFESTFLPEEECPKNPEEQRKKKIFPMDKNFSNYLKNMTEPLAWYLIERYKTKNFEFQKEPNKVKIATQAYIRENDLYESFIQTNVEKCSKSKLYLNSLYLKFHSWILLEHPHQSIPTKQMVKKYFINKWGNVIQENKNDGCFWPHWCLKDEES